VINSDPSAGATFNGHAMADMIALQDRAAQSIVDNPSGVRYSDLLTMGQLQGIIDHANVTQLNESIADGNADTQSAADRRTKWIAVGAQIAGHLPVIGPYVGDVKTVLSELFTNPVPNPEAVIGSRAMLPAQYSSIDNFYNAGLGNVDALKPLTDGDALMNYGHAVHKLGHGVVFDAVQNYLNSVSHMKGFNEVKLWTAWSESYHNASGS
jgi:hypothetical protein